MRRYQGEPLPPGSRIAVLANDAIGNFVVTTPLMQMLRSAHKPAELHYFGGSRTRELQQSSSLATAQFELFGHPPEVTARLAQRGGYHLVINVEWSCWAKSFAAQLSGGDTWVCGPCLDAEGRGDLPFQADSRGALAEDQNWVAEDLTSRYPFLKSSFIGEIFCRLAYLDGPVPGYQVPMRSAEMDFPDVLISTAASLPEKTWPVDKWKQVLAQLRSDGKSIGLLGAPPRAQGKYWKGLEGEDQLVSLGLVTDLRGKLSLPQVAGALAQAKAVLTIDNGILHLAVAGGRPTVGIFRHGIHRLWAPPSSVLSVLTPGEGKEVAELDVDAVCREVFSVL